MASKRLGPEHAYALSVARGAVLSAGRKFAAAANTYRKRDLVRSVQQMGDSERACIRVAAFLADEIASARREIDGPSAAPAKPEPGKVPCLEGYHWIGQSLRYCDKCSFPPWEHAGVAVLDEGSGPFSGTWVLRPFKPGEADRLRERWDR